jgi:hypothetical protein
MKMRKCLAQCLILVLLILSMSLLPLYATDTSSAQLSKIEQQLFSQDYSSDSTTARLDRLETQVYGAPRSDQPESARIEGLMQFIQPTSAPSTATTHPSPKQQTELNSPITQPPPTQEETALPGESQYPVISTMEQQVFKQTYEKEAIDSRLARLEQKVLGQSQQGTLQDRTDHLRMVVLGDATGSPNGSGYAQSNAPPSADMQKALPPIEKKVLGQTYPQDTIDARLSRVEMKLFNQTASDMSPDDRLYRIASILTAKNPSAGAGPTIGNTVGIWGPLLIMVLMSLI